MTSRTAAKHRFLPGGLAALTLLALLADIARGQQPPVASSLIPGTNWETLPLPSSSRLVADAGDGRLDDMDLISAAFVASGIEDECELATWLGRYAELRAETLAQVPRDDDDASWRAIHAALHARILTGRYNSSASDLRRALVHGEYNCLSSAVLYVDLCRTLGRDLELWSQPGHVFVKAQTASRERIEPGARKWQRQPATSRAARAERECDSSADGAARRITPLELLAKFYYNRGIELLTKRDYPAGLSLLQISLELDPADYDARQNLLAGINNWSVDCCRRRQYAEAAVLIQRGLELEPRFAPLRANERYLREKLAD